MRRAVFVFTIALAVGAGRADGRDGERSADQDLRAQMRRILERMDALERQHADDQRRISELEGRLGRAGGAAQLPPPPIPPPPPPPAVSPAAELSLAPPTAGGQGNLLNPQVTAFLDMGASVSTNGADETLNRFNLREAELDFRAAIAPFADGVLIVSMGEDLKESDGEPTIDTNFEIEEGYVNFHTLPFDLAIKGGKFRNAFGRNNVLHTHDLPQITRPAAVRAFLGPEGVATVGASVSWLVPNPWDTYLELTTELVNADGGPDSPILGGTAADNPAVVAHLDWFQDLGDSATLELGGSYLYTRTAPDPDFDASVFGLDATYRWLDPTAPDLRSFLVQSEFFWGSNDRTGADGRAFRNDSFGMYAFAQYQFQQNWYAGTRVDYTEFPNSEIFGPGDSEWGVSPYISWYPTEFLRLRFEYQHLESEKGPDRDSEENFLFGLTFSFGSHPPHPYWVNR